MAAPELVPADYIVIGAGIAGASIAYWLAPHGRTVILERESHPGYHTTGRSAAFYLTSYGTPQIRRLTMASRPFFSAPPTGFAEHPVIGPRIGLMLAGVGQEAQLDEAEATVRSVFPAAPRLDRAATCALVPVLRPECVLGSVTQPDGGDIDVHGLHQGFLRGACQAGASLICDAEVSALERDSGQWLVRTGSGATMREFRAPVVINAAGAWCDRVGALAGLRPLGLQPMRRSAFLFAPPPGIEVGAWPLTIATDHSCYFKPDAGLILASPANADPVEPHDVQPEEIDIATGIARIEALTTMTIRRPTRTWAGLRSFVPDGDLVGGFDPEAPGFFWLAGQGGYGVQTAPAAGEACAALARGIALPSALADFGLTAEMLSPARLRSS